MLNNLNDILFYLFIYLYLLCYFVRFKFGIIEIHTGKTALKIITEITKRYSFSLYISYLMTR